MTDLDALDELLRAQEGDAGCDAGVPIMDQYVEIELRGERPQPTRFPGTTIHLRVCPGCRADHDGVLEAARRFGDLDPEYGGKTRRCAGLISSTAPSHARRRPREERDHGPPAPHPHQHPPPAATLPGPLRGGRRAARPEPAAALQAAQAARAAGRTRRRERRAPRRRSAAPRALAADRGALLLVAAVALALLWSNSPRRGSYEPSGTPP